MDPRTKKPTFDIMQVDFEWVKKQDNVHTLKQALRALKDEGGYDALEKAVQQKIEDLQPSAEFLTRKIPSNEISKEERDLLDSEIAEWSSKMEESHAEISDEHTKQTVINHKKSEEEKLIGNDYMKTKDYKQAIEAYTRAIKLNVENSAAYANRAMARLSLKQYQLVIDDCDEAIKLDPEYTKAYLRRGKAKLALKEYRSAIPDFEFVLAREDLAQVNQDLKTCRDAVKESGGFKRISIIEEDEEEEEKVEEIDNNEEVIQQALKIKEESTVFYTQGNYTEAIRLLNEALNLLESLELTQKTKETLATIYNNLAACYMEETDHFKVIEFSSSAINLEPENEALKMKAYLRRGLASEKLERFQAAKSDLFKVKEIDPYNLEASEALARVNKSLENEAEKEAVKEAESRIQILQRLEKIKEKGNSNFQKNDLDNAVLEFTAGVELIKDYFTEESLLTDVEILTLFVNFLNNRALVNLKLDCNSLVIEDCNEVLKLEADNIKALYRLAKAQGLCNEFEEAARNMKKVMNLDPGNQAAKKEFDVLMKEAIAAKKVKQEEETKQSPKKVSFVEPEKIEEKKVLIQEEPFVERVTEETIKVEEKKKVISKEQVEAAKAKASSQANLLEIPKNAFGFESTANALVTEPELFFEFLTVRNKESLSPKKVSELFEGSQYTYELFIQTLNVLSGQEIEEEWFVDFLEALLTTSRFNMTVMFLSKSDKQKLREIVENTVRNGESKSNLIRNFKL